MFQITSGLSRSRLVRSSFGLADREIEGAQHVEAFMRLAQIRMRFLDDRAGLGEALRGLAGDRRDLGIDRRDAEIGRIGDALRPLAGARGRQERGRRRAAATADRPHARRSWRRAAAPDPRHCAPSALRRRDCGRSADRAYARRDRCSAACRRRRRSSRDCASEPPMSEPCASQAMPVASATAAPPEEPAADRDVSQGLSVAPNTSLKVLAPAPNSGVFDLA